MRAKMLLFQGVSAGLVLSAGLAGCSQSEPRVYSTDSQSRREAPPMLASTATETSSDSRPEPIVLADHQSSKPLSSPDQEGGPTTAGEQRGRVTLVVATAPPLRPAETPPHEPVNSEFWVAGNWRAETGAYVWQSGRIENGRSGQLFVPANWVASSRGWEFTPEYWR